MAKLILSDLANLENQSSAVATTNANSALIEAALEKTLSRDGTQPNAMAAQLDMNNNRITNLPRAISNTEPVRLQEVGDAPGYAIAAAASATAAAASELAMAAVLEEQDDVVAEAEAARDAAQAAQAAAELAAATVVNSLVFIGVWDASAGTFPGGGTAHIGYTWRVSVGGTVGGIAFGVGDSVAAIVLNASTTVYAGNWVKFAGSLTSAQIIAALGYTPMSNVIATQAEAVAGTENTKPMTSLRVNQAVNASRNPLNMVALGCDNTGVTNCSSLIQTIINNNTAGNPLFFPAGIYKFTGITSSNPVHILGAGSAYGPGTTPAGPATIFKNSSNTGTLFHITSYQSSIFRDFSVTAASGTPTAGIAIYLDTTGTSNQTGTEISGCSFVNVWTAIQILRPFFPKIFNNYFNIWGNFGIVLSTSSLVEGGGGFIHHNMFFGDYDPAIGYSPYTTGAIYSEVGYINIHDNAILGGPYGIQIAVNNHPAGFIKVHDNTIENFQNAGVSIATIDGSLTTLVMIQNNEFSSYITTPTAAILIWDSTITNAWVDTVLIQGNTTRMTSAVSGRHIWLAAGSNVTISGNAMNEIGVNSPYGITVTGISTHAGLIAPIQVIDNTFKGTFGTYYLDATGAMFKRDNFGH